MTLSDCNVLVKKIKMFLLFLQSGYELAPPYSDYTRVCDVVLDGVRVWGNHVGGAGDGYVFVN